MYFSNCHTAEECKARYRELSKKLHPDKGGSSSDFQQMQEEYEARLRELLGGSRPNSIEYGKLVKHLLDILKITKPDYYELVQLFGKNPTVTLVSQLIGELAPKHKPTIDGIINLLQ